MRVAIDGAASVLDRHCLDFCISLLDHDLRGNLFESVVVGCLYALGIDLEDRKSVV